MNINRLIDKYITREQNLEIWQQSQDLTSDLKFIEDFSLRIKKSNNFDFLIFPTIKGNINGLFLEKLFQDIRHNYNAEVIEKRLKLFYLTQKIFDEIRSENKEEESLNDFVILWNYYNRALDIDILEEIDNFIGCSHECSEIHQILFGKLMNSENNEQYNLYIKSVF